MENKQLEKTELEKIINILLNQNLTQIEKEAIQNIIKGQNEDFISKVNELISLKEKYSDKVKSKGAILLLASGCGLPEIQKLLLEDKEIDKDFFVTLDHLGEIVIDSLRFSILRGQLESMRSLLIGRKIDPSQKKFAAPDLHTAFSDLDFAIVTNNPKIFKLLLCFIPEENLDKILSDIKLYQEIVDDKKIRTQELQELYAFTVELRRYNTGIYEIEKLLDPNHRKELLEEIFKLKEIIGKESFTVGECLKFASKGQYIDSASLSLNKLARIGKLFQGIVNVSFNRIKKEEFGKKISEKLEDKNITNLAPKTPADITLKSSTIQSLPDEALANIAYWTARIEQKERSEKGVIVVKQKKITKNESDIKDGEKEENQDKGWKK